MNARAFEPDSIERAMDAITSDERECESFGNALIDFYREELRELMTGAYGYRGAALHRFALILEACQARLELRAEHHLQTRGF